MWVKRRRPAHRGCGVRYQTKHTHGGAPALVKAAADRPMSLHGPAMMHAGRILFIDDDAAVRHSFRRIVNRAGLAVDLAGSVHEAVGLATRQSYAVVAADFLMPDEDGVSATRRIQGLQPEATFLLITASPEAAQQRLEGSAVAAQLVAKPWDSDALIELLRRELASHERRAAECQVRLALAPEAPRRWRILAIDGGEQLAAHLDRLGSLLGEPELEVALARSVEAARACLDHQEHAAAVLVPGPGGLTELAQLVAAAPELPVVVVCPGADLAQARQAVRLGASDCITETGGLRDALVRALAFALERRRASDRNARVSRYSAQTGLPNRTAFRDCLERALAQAQSAGTGVGLLLVDIDRFRDVNDAWGRDTGDEVLRGVADRLRLAARDGDTAAHLSGDTFALVAENLDRDPAAAQREVNALARRILAALQTPLPLAPHDVLATASIGAALAPPCRTVDALVEIADRALTQAQRRGRAQVAVLGQEGPGQRAAQLSLEGELSGALARGEFVLHYQPQIELGSGRVVGAEALIRWQRDGRLVPPATFIPLLEETGLIVSAGEWILRTAARECVRLAQLGLPPLRMSVNISVRQLQDGDLVETVARVLRDTGMEPAHLDLELTESMLLDGSARAIDTLDRLKALGLRLSIDDFGTGYSCLQYLRRYPVDELKVDRSFVADIADVADIAGPDGPGSIVCAVIALGHSLGLEVIAEGVETAAQERFLRDQGCDLAQGFRFSRPLPAAELESWLRGATGAAPTGAAPTGAAP
jgi:diguanylate cyclase (GGDEF)-like protein